MTSKGMTGLLTGIAGLLLFTSAARADGTPTAVDGGKIYLKTCQPCHSVGPEGGAEAKEKGGSLDHITSKHDEVWLRQQLKDPSLHKTKMPQLNLSDKEIDALIAWMYSHAPHHGQDR